MINVGSGQIVPKPKTRFLLANRSAFLPEMLRPGMTALKKVEKSAPTDRRISRANWNELE
jgi:hypothetical protein